MLVYQCKAILGLRMKFSLFTFSVYVEASDACNTLTFQLGGAAIQATLATRQWSIKVVHLIQH